MVQNHNVTEVQPQLCGLAAETLLPHRSRQILVSTEAGADGESLCLNWHSEPEIENAKRVLSAETLIGNTRTSTAF